MTADPSNDGYNSPFNLSLLPQEVCDHLLSTFSTSCGAPTLLSLMRLSRECYEHFSPALYCHIVLDSRSSKLLFKGLNFPLEYNAIHTQWAKEREERDKELKRERESQRSSWAWWSKWGSGESRQGKKKSGGGVMRDAKSKIEEGEGVGAKHHRQLNSLDRNDALTKIRNVDDLDLVGDPLKDLKMKDALSVHLRKFNHLQNVKSITIESFEGLYHLSETLKSASSISRYGFALRHTHESYVDVDTGPHGKDNGQDREPRFLEGVEGLYLNSNIRCPSRYTSKGSKEEYFMDHDEISMTTLMEDYMWYIKQNLKPRKVCLDIKATYPSTVGRNIKSIGEGWYLDEFTVHIQLPQTPNASSKSDLSQAMGTGKTTDIGQMSAFEYLKANLGDLETDSGPGGGAGRGEGLPNTKKIRFIFQYSCTQDPACFNVSPKMMAKKEIVGGAGETWELVDRTCWDCLSWILRKVEEDDWIERNSYFPNEEEVSSQCQENVQCTQLDLDKEKRKEKEKEKDRVKIKPVVEIINLPCLRGLTQESMRSSAMTETSGDSTSRLGNDGMILAHGDELTDDWSAARSAWLERSFRILSKDD
ncbi:uncharacterized protein I303_102300 [Kwoniella dejecticola CBS 10117]|uniref:F-box domain-containing protein n=1 Tax=Kwoniella dejecticola CBS 10117 TaxID=1296121 RepID=A0A1A6ABC9_9TREE|nr:uncharacterized protein I303_01560 [Kwoniella dejecticola CBS 10117]OBR87358.1 hypothetical protein I303_01560 [Kwoniella dejecticola CBS 10117]